MFEHLSDRGSDLIGLFDSRSLNAVTPRHLIEAKLGLGQVEAQRILVWFLLSLPPVSQQVDLQEPLRPVVADHELDVEAWHRSSEFDSNRRELTTLDARAVSERQLRDVEDGDVLCSQVACPLQPSESGPDRRQATVRSVRHSGFPANLIGEVLVEVCRLRLRLTGTPVCSMIVDLNQRY